MSRQEVEGSEGEAAICKNWVKPDSSAETTLMNSYFEAIGWFGLKFYNQCKIIQANHNKDSKITVVLFFQGKYLRSVPDDISEPFE